MTTALLRKQPQTNLSENERMLSIVAGAGLIGLGLMRRGGFGAGLAAMGSTLAYRGFTGVCPAFKALGINTSERGHEKGTGSKKGVPYEQGIRIDQEVRIHRPAHELYQFWRNFENLPEFMDHLESVEMKGDKVSHWVVRGPGGYKVSWDAEIVNEVQDKLIGWRSLPGSQVASGGSVHFDETGDGSTIVRVSLQYNPPAGNIGAMISKAMGEDPQQMIREDLMHFRELMENRTLTHGTGGSRDHDRASKRRTRRTDRTDAVQSASEDSFPASDAPSWTPETT